jgi:catechol 2,3-dioxygenase-like lactoylglutathione lyase family enzyme
MEAIGLEWIGTRTPRFEETSAFFRGVLGLPIGMQRPSFVRFDLPDGGSIEVFRPGGPDDHSYFTTGPVVGIQVKDFDGARSELGRAGIPLLGEPGGELGDYRWQHFRGPDGAVYEIVDDPNRKSTDSPIGPCGVRGFGWVGIRTAEFDAMRRFVSNLLNLDLEEEDREAAVFRFQNGDYLEVFQPGGPLDHTHLTTGPMPGLVVQDLDSAESHLCRHHIEMPQRRRFGNAGWTHFRAPDGYIYEIKRFGDDRAGRWKAPQV